MSFLISHRHFYENIGKYDQFVGGWVDARDSWYQEEKNVGDSTEIVIKTPFKQTYIDDRFDANQMLDYVLCLFHYWIDFNCSWWASNGYTCI